MNATELAPTSPAAKLKEKFWQLKRSRIRIVPTHTTRSSSVGEECERRLVYDRTAGEFRVVHDERVQALFDLGNHAERFVVRELEEMGIDVHERARDYFDRELELTGHIDGKLIIPGVDRPVPAEIKGLNPFTAERIETLDDIRESRQGWVRKYYAQLQAYLHLDKSPLGVFVLLNKVSGEIAFIDCPADAAFADELLAKVRRVRDAVRGGVLPDRRQSSDCARCPYVHVCLPDRNFGEAVKVLDEPELIEAIRRREAARDAKREYDAADRAVKQMLQGASGELLVGPYAVIGSEVKRKAYAVSSGSYVRWEVRLTGTAPAPPAPQLLNPFGPGKGPVVPPTTTKDSDDDF